MKLFTGKFWLPFPCTEYGGMWVVVARDEAECVEFLKKEYEGSPRDDAEVNYDDRLRAAVARAKQFELVDGYTAGVAETFFT